MIRHGEGLFPPGDAPVYLLPEGSQPAEIPAPGVDHRIGQLGKTPVPDLQQPVVGRQPAVDVVQQTVPLEEHPVQVSHGPLVSGHHLGDGPVQESPPLAGSVPDQGETGGGEYHRKELPGEFTHRHRQFVEGSGALAALQGEGDHLLPSAALEPGGDVGGFLSEADQVGLSCLSETFLSCQEVEGFYQVGLALGVVAVDDVDAGGGLQG